MGENEIMRALECCSQKEANCKECPLDERDSRCVVKLNGFALGLVRRQQAEIEDLIKQSDERLSENRRIIRRNSELRDELESLESRISALNDTNKILMETQEVYANNKLKEFAGRLEEKVTYYEDECDNFVPWVDCRDIDDLVEEMTEGKCEFYESEGAE